MTQKGLRRMGWIAFGLAAAALAAYGALQFAIGRNGPAVLDAVDRLTGGSRDVVLVHRAATGESPQQKVAVYRADGKGPARPVILFVHGGSWRMGNPDDYGFVARGLAPEGYVVVLAGYRLVPGGEYPAMLEDTASAVAWVRANIAHYGGDPDAIFLAGHSAGAYNAAQVALDPQWLERDGLNSSIIRGVIGLSGPYDFLPLDSDSTKAAFGGAAVLSATQPVNFARKDAPPMLLIQGESDTTVKPRNTVALAAAITRAGSKARSLFLPGADHNAPLLALASPWRSDRQVLDSINGFVSEVLAEQGSSPLKTSVPVQAEGR